MNCLEFRQISVTEPKNLDNDYLEHQLSCQSCQSFARDIKEFDEHLESAVKISVPYDLISTILHRQSMFTHKVTGIAKRLIPAVAASIIFVTGLIIGLLYHSPQSQSGVEQALVTYVNNYQDFHGTTKTVSHASVSELLSSFGIELTGNLGTVNYAAPCYIRDQMAAHLMLTGKSGPIIALFMPSEQLDSRQTFRFGQYVGIIIPCPRGSLALIGVFGEALADMETRIRNSVTWL